MKGKIFASSLFRFRNISLFLLALLVVFADSNGFFVPGSSLIPAEVIGYSASVALYFALVLQTVNNKSFQDNFLRKQKAREIRGLNAACLRHFAEARKNVNQAYFQRLKKVMDDRNDIMSAFYRGERNFLKEKVVEQALNLVVAYIKLINNYSIRSRELANVNVNDVTTRINMNNRKLTFTKDHSAADDIRKVIEMDERIIERLKDEKKELERLNAKLDYMESTVSMLKHQMLSNIESQDMLEKLETAVNEASALDTVLQERRKDRNRHR